MRSREAPRPLSPPRANGPASTLEQTLSGVPPGPQRPAHSLRRRFVLAIVALVAFVLVALAAALVLTGRSSLRRDLEAMLWVITLALVLATLLAMLLARPILRPLSALTAGATALAEGRLDTRLQVTTGDELEVLARTLNQMASRLSASIAQLEAGNRALSQSNVELRELDRLKSDLLANVSHELRTPLTSVKGWLEALAEELLGPLNETQREALEVSRRNLDRQLHLIGELLSYARFESAGVHLERQPTDLAAIVAQVVAGVRASRPLELDLRLEVEADLPLADVDAARLAQVVENLLTNAVKFTPAGGTVTVRLYRSGDLLAVEVADTGIGIAREDQSRIFERFHQVQSSSTRRYGGIGLGLAIVRQILDAHGCVIELDSAPGRGSTFRFHLPAAPAAESAGTTGPLLAVIDADVPFARGLADHLAAAGWRVRIAGSFACAERLVRESRPRLVVLDRLLPDGDGFDLIGRWRRDPDHRQMAILVLSMRDEEALARRLGADGCLLKPVAPARVLTEIARVLAAAAVASAPDEAVS
jgi:signal transduction histidine kinase/CheY-like chemotaxis protein